ncbi:hypothetical protein ABH945_001081 [Paraburkholderia sp. GAS333]
MGFLNFGLKGAMPVLTTLHAPGVDDVTVRGVATHR